MGVTVSATSSHQKLVTLADVKAALKISTSTSYDSELNDIIDRASDAIRDHCNRTFRLEGYTETLPGDGSQYLKLTKTPIVEITTVTLRGDTVTGYSIEDREAGILYRELGWEWTVAAGLGTLEKFPIPDGDLRVFSAQYAAGYRMPDNSSASSTSTGAVIKQLPGRIKQAALVTIVSWFKGSDRDEEVQSKTIGPYSITYAMRNAQSGGLPAKAEALLSKWEEPYSRY